MAIFGPVLDTRPLFPVERRALLELLSALPAADWAKPTVCPGWDVHDVVGHVLNDYLRRLSGSRDGHSGAVFTNDETLPTYLARTNDEFVRAARQLSPRVMIELIEHLGGQLDAVWAEADPEGPADLDVSWADPTAPSPAWLDIARDFTELWVHQQQVRDAVNRPGAQGPELLNPVLDTFLRALPYTLRDEERPDGTTVRVEVTGAAGGTWAVVRTSRGWRPTPADTTDPPAARVVTSPDTLWRLASRGIDVLEGRQRSRLYGDPGLTAAVTTLLGVVR